MELLNRESTAEVLKDRHFSKRFQSAAQNTVHVFIVSAGLPTLIMSSPSPPPSPFLTRNTNDIL
jgi:hypothetical protein